MDIKSIRAKNLPSACEVSSDDILLRCDWRKELERRDAELTCRLVRRVSEEECILPEECMPPDEEWWLRRGGKSSEGGIPVGVVGSERNSRSKPPALIFISVSFSGVMLLAVVAEVSAIIAMLRICSRKKVNRYRVQIVTRTYTSTANMTTWKRFVELRSCQTNLRSYT